MNGLLPKLTALQYLVLNLLFVGRQSGDQLRGALRAMGVRQSRAAFCQLMARLIEANYVRSSSDKRSAAGQVVHYRFYEVTDLGVLGWTTARRFYLNLGPPSLDLIPVETHDGQNAPYDPKTRKQLLRREVYSGLRRWASAVLGIPPRKIRKKTSAKWKGV